MAPEVPVVPHAAINELQLAQFVFQRRRAMWGYGALAIFFALCSLVTVPAFVAYNGRHSLKFAIIAFVVLVP